MQPFIDISILPSYGTHSCLVKWIVQEGFESGDFYIYRSPDGGGNWELLNPVVDGVEQPINALEFEDNNFLFTGRIGTPHYRILLEHEGEDYDSPVVGAYGKLNEREFNLCRRILQLELRRIKTARNGIKVLVFKPLTRGTVCRCVDVKSGQHVASSLCPICYGQGFEGGFTRPFVTWMEKNQISPTAVMDSEIGSSDPKKITVAIPSFPALRTGDMVVYPEVDARYLVESCQPYLFRGISPVRYDATLDLLRRTDIRYKLQFDTDEE